MSRVQAPDGQGRVRWVGVAAASQLLGVHPSTLRQWTTQGRLPAFLTPGGHRRYREADLQAFRARLPRGALRRSLAAAILTAQPRCGLSGSAAGHAYAWLAQCDESRRQRPRLLGGALVRLLAHYVAAEEHDADRSLHQACEHAAEYGALAIDLGLSPAAAIEAFTVCRAPIVAAAQNWAGQATAGDPGAVDILARVSHFFDATLLSMVQALERPLTH